MRRIDIGKHSIVGYVGYISVKLVGHWMDAFMLLVLMILDSLVYQKVNTTRCYVLFSLCFIFIQNGWPCFELG